MYKNNIQNYIYAKAHFQQIIQKATIQTLNINFHNAYI